MGRSLTVGTGDAQPRPGSPGFDPTTTPYTQPPQQAPTLQTTPQQTTTPLHTAYGEPQLPAPPVPEGYTPAGRAVTTALPASTDTTHVLQSPQVLGSRVDVQVSPQTAQGAQQVREQQATLEANLAQAAAQTTLQETIMVLTNMVASLNDRLKGL